MFPSHAASSAQVFSVALMAADRRGYWCVLEPFPVHAMLADRALCVLTKSWGLHVTRPEVACVPG
jgi:hypothetical protein